MYRRAARQSRARGDEGENATGRRFHPRSNENREMKERAMPRRATTIFSEGRQSGAESQLKRTLHARAERGHILLCGGKRAAWVLRTLLAFCEPPRSNLRSFACEITDSLRLIITKGANAVCSLYITPRDSAVYHARLVEHITQESTHRVLSCLVMPCLREQMLRRAARRSRAQGAVEWGRNRRSPTERRTWYVGGRKRR